MRVVHVGKYYWPYQRGIETYLKTLAEGLSLLCDLTVIVSNDKCETVEENVCGVNVIRLARNFHLNSTDFLFGLPKKLKELKPDIVHIHLPNPWAETAWKLAGRPGRLFISYHSDIIRQKFLLKLYAPFHRATLESADKIIVATPNHIKYSPFLSKLPKEKLEVIHYGLPKIDFPAPRSMARPFILTVGQLVYYKGFDVLIKAVADIPDLDLVIVGCGPLENKLKALAEALGIKERVKFPGHVSREELLQYYADCEFFVLPSTFRSEAFGIVQLEAFQAGKPVISTDLRSGVPYVNQDSKTGIVVPSGDVRALNEAMKALHGDPETRQRLGTAARERALRDFSAEEMVKRTFALYSPKA
ncbi:glycosyltransferase [bacterium]|nr:glycosyltransferase [bacterium]